ncbi:ribonuclease T2 [Gammaproteobacteria bacterium]
MIRRISILILLLATTLSSSLSAVPATGSFAATSVCPAYVSKNRQTNPDNARIVVGTRYPVIEANQADHPTWYRLRIATVNPSERWVDVQCGTVKPEPAIGGNSGGAGDCNTPGLADSYVFAVSWQSAFCETHRDKPECGSAAPQGWATSNFTLHGIWPSLTKCGANYAFCSPQPQQKVFCTYPTLPLSNSVKVALGEVMPSATAGSCLQRHEWYKHGTCQKEWDVNSYFEVGVNLTRQFNDSGIGPFVAKHVGKVVNTQDFLAEIDRDLGVGASKRMKFNCQNGNLVDIYMNLPMTIPATPKLAELLQQGKPGFTSDCGSSFRVDAVGYQ